MREKLPKKGQRVMTNTGAAVVVGGNPLKQTVLVELKSGATIELPVGEVTIEAEQPHKQQKKKD
jgi:cell fate regulator YaaT (PSP1 superfamily)